MEDYTVKIKVKVATKAALQLVPKDGVKRLGDLTGN